MYRDFINCILDIERGEDLCLHRALPKTMYPGSDGWLGECSSSYPITGIPVVAERIYTRAFPSQMIFCLPSEIWSSSVFPVDTEELQGNVMQEQSNTWESGRIRTSWGCQSVRNLYSYLGSFFQLFYLNIPRFSRHFKSKIRKLTLKIWNSFKLVSALWDISCFPPLVSLQPSFSFSGSCVQPVQRLILQEIKYYVINMSQKSKLGSWVTAFRTASWTTPYATEYTPYYSCIMCKCP